MRCAQCDCHSDEAPGWVAVLAGDRNAGAKPTALYFCPPCAAREFKYAARAAADYI